MQQPDSTLTAAYAHRTGQGTVTLPEGSQYPDTHPTVSLAEYAVLIGQSARTVREKVRRGEIPAELVKGRRGLEYRLRHPNSTVPVTLSEDSLQGDTQPNSTLPPASIAELAQLLRDKDQVIERLARDNVEMAGRLGFVMGQLEEARTKIALLEAPAPAASNGASVETTNHPAAAGNGPRRPWWAFWRGMGQPV